MKERDFIFDSVQLLYYKYYKVSFSCGGLHIDSPEWIKKKKATINPKYTDDKFFQFAASFQFESRESFKY